MIGRRRKNLPKWRYDFNCRKCDNIQFIDDPARGRLGDYCVACVEAFDQGRPNPIHADDDRVGNRIRPGDPVPMIYYSGGGYVATAPTKCCEKPEGVAVELADAVIRIADLCGHLGIDLDAVIAEKMAYNAGRPYKHGKRF